MRLELLVGGREYLRPSKIRRRRIERMARRRNDDTVVPSFRWFPEEDDPYCDTFLDEEEEEATTRVELVVEFLRDVVAPDGVVAIVVPWESCLVPDPSKLYDPRTIELVKVARTMFGEDGVGCTRFAISENTQAVLRALHERCERPEPEAIDSPDVPVHMEYVETTVSVPNDFSEMWSNYTRTIIGLAECAVEPETIFGGRDRPDIIAAHLERTQQLVRPEIPPEKVLDALEPGGGLHELFTRPLPLPLAQ